MIDQSLVPFLEDLRGCAHELREVAEAAGALSDVGYLRRASFMIVRAATVAARVSSAIGNRHACPEDREEFKPVLSEMKANYLRLKPYAEESIRRREAGEEF